MAGQTGVAGPNQTEQAQEAKESKTPEKELSPRVSRKVDMNNVEVSLGKSTKGKKFEVYDNGVLHGEFESNGEETQTIPLSKYLKRGILHNFIVQEAK